MAASPKEKFDAAVAVIETLPKNGNFIPSHTLLLQFYGYYKQATLGPCNIPKPAFWDVIGKAKWGAWNKLGQMDKEEAMLAYVDELKKVLNQQYPQGYNKEEIVEAMPHTETVQNFVQKLGNFYEIVDPPPTESVDPNKGQGDGSGDSGQGSLPGTPQRSSGANSEDDTSHDPNNSSKDTLEDSEQELDRDELLIRTIKHDQTDAISHDQQYQNGYPIEINSIDINGKSPATINGNMGTMPTGPEMVALNGGPGHLDLLENSSESEGEEFCDTSDAPLIQEKLTENSAQSRVSQARVSSLTNAQSSNSVGLRPSGSSSQFLMSDPGQMMDRNWSSTNVTLTPNQSMSDMLTMRGGGETSTGNPPGMHTDGGNPQGLPAQGRGAVPRRAHSGASRQHLMSAVGGSGGRDNEGSSGSPSQQFPDLNEQIAVALIRLQQDMNSVLTRLNTLEGLTVAQRDRDRETSASGQRAMGRSVWWWPFSGVRGRTIFFMLVWPFIVHWIITFLSRRRNRRR